MRRAQVTIVLEDEASTELTWDVHYRMLGRYRPATASGPAEFPEADVHVARLVEVNGLPAKAEDHGHYSEEWDGLFADQFDEALRKADAELYTVPDRADVVCFGRDRY